MPWSSTDPIKLLEFFSIQPSLVIVFLSHNQVAVSMLGVGVLMFWQNLRKSIVCILQLHHWSNLWPCNTLHSQMVGVTLVLKSSCCQHKSNLWHPIFFAFVKRVFRYLAFSEGRLQYLIYRFRVFDLLFFDLFFSGVV